MLMKFSLPLKQPKKTEFFLLEEDFFVLQKFQPHGRYSLVSVLELYL